MLKRREQQRAAESEAAGEIEAFVHAADRE
jgi:hypothetical protein